MIFQKLDTVMFLTYPVLFGIMLSISFIPLLFHFIVVETGHGMKGRREIIDNNRKQFMVIAGKDCTVQNFTSNPKDPFYEVKDYKSGNDFFYFGPDNATTYVGNYTIRGIK